MSDNALPDHLKGKKHWDFPKWLQWIPRAWTSYLFVQPPTILAGNQRNISEFMFFSGNSYFYKDPNRRIRRHYNNKQFGPGPIPNSVCAGFYWGIHGIQLRKWLPKLPLYFACSLVSYKHLTHFRIGCRWDDIDSYYTFPTIAFFRRAI